MRIMEFTIEDNKDKLVIGQDVNIIEGKLPSSYYYFIENAIGMSANFSNAERLNTRVGKVAEIKETPRFNYAVLIFDE